MKKRTEERRREEEKKKKKKKNKKKGMELFVYGFVTLSMKTRVLYGSVCIETSGSMSRV